MSFTDGIVLPFWNEGNIEYVRYTPVSVVCHLGEDCAGHYIIYNFSDDVVMISDSVVRYADADDITIMKNRSVLIFWSRESFSEEPYEGPIDQIICAMKDLENGTNGASCPLDPVDIDEPDVVDEIRPKTARLKEP